ncbi:MAG: hypothetical protein AMJ73_08405 [candidate division Zixibacteria bacterium SM1_73]|nr:MAG: hypothetical protein AMJ73_08405 [candidate division Zixibacteria bacterium SM1_73]
MRKKIFAFWRLAAIALGVLMVWTAPTLAWDCQQEYHNNTGQTATDLRKVLDREVTITAAIHDKFAQHEWWHEDGKTIIRWYDGAVEHCEWTWACFDFQGADQVEVEEVYWTQGGSPYDDAGSSIGGGASFGTGSSAGYADVTIVARNSLNSQFSDTATIYATNVYWAVVLHRYDLNELNQSLFVDPSITWNPLPDFQLAYEESENIPLGDVRSNTYILFRFHAEQAEGALPVTEIWQIQVPPQGPTLTQWGLLILVILIVSSGVFIMGRRRKAAVPA